MGVLARLKSRLGKTREAIGDGISGLFRGGRKIDDELFSELEELLWTSDLGPIAAELCEELAKALGPFVVGDGIGLHRRRVIIAIAGVSEKRNHDAIRLAQLAHEI